MKLNADISNSRNSDTAGFEDNALDSSEKGSREVYKPLVSVIMPVYNAEKHIKKSLRTLLSQTYTNIEIICVNDGSTDNSLEILNIMSSADKRIKVINQKNGGPAKARNTGLNAAAGKYISFVDADDYVEQNMYSYLVDTAEAERADILVFGGSPCPWENAPEWIMKKLSPRTIAYEGDDAGEIALFEENSSIPFLWIQFIRRDILEYPTKIRLKEDIDLGEDQVFQFEYFPRAKKVVYSDKRLYFYRWDNEGSLMWKYNHMHTEKFRKHLKIVENVFKDWQERGADDKYGYLASWMVTFLYYDLIKFPKFIQIEFAKQIISLADQYDVHLFMCNEYEYEHGKEIVAMAECDNLNEDILNESISSLKSEIQDIENKIQAELNSKAFRLGKLLTPKKKRLNISAVLPPEIKKN